MNKYEQLIEFIINEQEDKARELFHQIVVEKSREIYESLIDETDLAEVGGNDVEEMVDEITMDEEGMAEEAEDGAAEHNDVEGEEEVEFDMDEPEDEMDLDDQEAGEEELEDKVMSLEDELEALKAKFDELMGHEEAEHGDEEGEADAEMPDVMEAEHDKEEEEEEEEDVEESVQESKKSSRKMTEAEWIREYVEKISNTNSETGEVGHGGSVSLNTKSPVAGKNDMGGTAANIAHGGAEADPSGTPSKKASGLLKNGADLIGKVQNTPGANAGKTAYASKAPAAKTGEVGGTNDKSPVAK